jgi:hypothetical protein
VPIGQAALSITERYKEDKDFSWSSLVSKYFSGMRQENIKK